MRELAPIAAARQHAAMNQRFLFASILCAALVAGTGVASAGGQSGAFGVGAEYQLSGVGGLSGIYDGGMFHAGAFLGLQRINGQNGAPSTTAVDVGGEFYYHVHTTATADFGIGGSLGVASVPTVVMNMETSKTELFLEPAFQIRLFLSANVAVSFTGGIVLGLADAHEIDVTASAGNGVTGGIGVHYYFF